MPACAHCVHTRLLSWVPRVWAGTCREVCSASGSWTPRTCGTRRENSQVWVCRLRFFFLFSISSTQVWRTRSHFECSSWRVNAPRTHRPRGGLHFGVKIWGLKKASFLITFYMSSILYIIHTNSSLHHFITSSTHQLNVIKLITTSKMVKNGRFWGS